MKNKSLRFKILFFLSIVLIIGGFFSLTISAFAQSNAYNYTQLERVPGFEDSGNDLGSYISSIYQFGIWAVGIAAILMITIGGFMYLTSAGNTSKMDVAKRVVTDAIIGLIIALVAYLVLYVINPDLIKINVSMQQLGPGTTSPPGTPGGTAPVGVRVTSPTGVSVTSPPRVGGGSCGGLSTQSGIGSQCSDATSELSSLLTCIQSKQPGAVISSISDSQGYSNCVNNYNRPPCAHAQYSCHYGGRSCRGNGSYAVDLTTRNLSGTQLKAAARDCGASFALDEGNHVHASVGNQAGCNCQ